MSETIHAVEVDENESSKAENEANESDDLKQLSKPNLKNKGTMMGQT